MSEETTIETATVRQRIDNTRLDSLALIFAITYPTIALLLYFVALADLPPFIQKTSYLVCKAIQFGFPLFWVYGVQQRRDSRHERDQADKASRLSTTRSPVVRTKYAIVEGLAFGSAVLFVMLEVYHWVLKPIGLLGPGSSVSEAIAGKLTGFGISSVAAYIVFGVFISLIHSFLEEYYWRWFTFRQLKRLLPVGRAILISSVGFMLHHIFILAIYFGWTNPATWLFSLAVAVGGAYWAWLYHRTGSLAGAWLSHAVIDVAIFIIGYDLIQSMLMVG